VSRRLKIIITHFSACIISEGFLLRLPSIMLDHVQPFNKSDICFLPIVCILCSGFLQDGAQALGLSSCGRHKRVAIIHTAYSRIYTCIPFGCVGGPEDGLGSFHETAGQRAKQKSGRSRQFGTTHFPPLKVHQIDGACGSTQSDILDDEDRSMLHITCAWMGLGRPSAKSWVAVSVCGAEAITQNP
jgi:hypothetical protein